MKETRMFKLWLDGRVKTFNPIHGCKFECYSGRCWASQMAKRLQAAGAKGYATGFEPTFSPELLNRIFSECEIVFVGSMGDISFFPLNVHKQIIEKVVMKNPKTLFFFETKNPSIYARWMPFLPENVILSTTIETNRDYHLSKAPKTELRYAAFKNILWPKKHVSIEPIMDFDLDVLVDWMRKIAPLMVSIGYDNHFCNLPEPSLGKTMKLIAELEKFTRVEKKTLREATKVNERF